ncbi:MAG: hypothetical protein KIH01_02740 [Candidatus Freyarchaeota archaeon]|nr:hypothetical protein [Candidatus Jordarchaeia archaeon]
MDESWPYLLFLPADPYDLKTFLLEVFGSPITLEILEKIDRGVQAQKDIIKQLRHSNKTIILHLKNLVRLRVLEEEYRVKGGKHTVWYKPTDIGRWILLMFKRRLPSIDLEKVLEELLSSYLNNIIELCLKKGMNVEKLEDAFSAAVARGLTNSQRAVFEPEVVVYGAVSTDYSLYGEQSVPSICLLHNVQEALGGSGGNVAVALSRLGVKASFAGKVGGDLFGWRIASVLIKEGVDVSNLIIDRNLKTPKTIAIFERGQKRTYVTATAKTALSISDPGEINWDLVKNAKAVCICEMFREISELIASYAKTRKVKVFYKPAILYLGEGFKRVEGILRNTDFLVLGERGWNMLSKEVGDVSHFFELGMQCLIVFKGVRKGCVLYTKEKVIEIEGINVNVSDESRTKDAFLAGFIKSTLDGKGLIESAHFGIAVSAVAAQKAGMEISMPRLEDVLKILEGDGGHAQSYV